MQIFETLWTAENEPAMSAALAAIGLHGDAGRAGGAHYAINRVGALRVETGETESIETDGVEYTTPIMQTLPGWRVQILWQGATPPAPPAGVTEDWRTGDAAPRPDEWAGVAPPPASADAPIEAAGAPSDVPAVVSDRQFFHACAHAGLITQDEALAAVRTGDLPAVLQDIVDLIPPPYDFDVRMSLQGESTFRRVHPFVEMISRSLGWSEAQVDDLFRLAGTL